MLYCIGGSPKFYGYYASKQIFVLGLYGPVNKQKKNKRNNTHKNSTSKLGNMQ